MRLEIAPGGRSLQRDGQPFFWLADTCWSAFTNIADDEWEAYLDRRAAQGFNVLQINTLPQWDRCGSLLDCQPFPRREDGICYDFSRILPGYFARAQKMCAAAVQRGFTLALVVMWCNYVPGTWASEMFGGNVIPEEAVEPIVRTVCESFRPFDPVWIISGDTGFDSEASICRYRMVADLVDKYAPSGLRAYHIKGRYDGLPDEFARRADLYFYQSGHNAAAQAMSWQLAERFAARTPVRPVINSEPCYEQMGYSHKLYGRFRRPDIRRALWCSLLSGAGAGITYGAHGVWNWQKPDMPKNPLGGEGFLEALPCRAALDFPGAADFAFAKSLFSKYGITAPTPCQEIIAQYADEVRAARTGAAVLLYLPTNAPLPLRGDWTGWRACAIDLESKACVPVAIRQDGACAQLSMHPFYQDALIILDHDALSKVRES